MQPKETIIVCQLGRQPYVPMWELQRAIQTRLIAAKRATPVEHIPHVLLLVEHPPVYTLGKSGAPENLLASEDELAERGAVFHQIDRGGDITFHGPGQLVGYPILDLDRFFRDIHLYMRNLEEVIIRTCSDFGLNTGRSEGRTGVWIGPDAQGLERKICAMGIRCSRWVTMHGFALNVATDLSFFSNIVPCGIDDRDVTSLVQECNALISLSDVQAPLALHFGDVFGANIERLDQAASEAYLEKHFGIAVSEFA